MSAGNNEQIRYVILAIAASSLILIASVLDIVCTQCTVLQPLWCVQEVKLTNILENLAAFFSVAVTHNLLTDPEGLSMFLHTHGEVLLFQHFVIARRSHIYINVLFWNSDTTHVHIIWLKYTSSQLPFVDKLRNPVSMRTYQLLQAPKPLTPILI